MKNPVIVLCVGVLLVWLSMFLIEAFRGPAELLRQIKARPAAIKSQSSVNLREAR